MGDALEPSTAPVTDRRVPPRGALPRRQLAVWGIGLVAIVIVLFALTAPSAKPRTATGRPIPEASAPLDAKPLIAKAQNYLEQDRQARERAASQPAPMPQMLSEPSSRYGMGAGGGTGGTTQAQPDPIEADRKKREYESLFASNVVVGRRGGSSQGSGGGAPDRMPTLDETAAAVMRAAGQAPQTYRGAAVPGLTPAISATGAVPAAETTRRTPPITDAGPMHTLLEGTLIDAVLTNRLDGSSASPVNAMVTNPVYSHNGDRVLIPAGARVLGDTKPVTNFGESRLAVSFHRLIFPDGSTVSLDQFKGLNQAGDTGIHDQVNNHYLSTFGAAAAVGFVNGLGQSVGNAGLGGSGSNRTVVVAGNVGNSSTQATSQVMNRFLNRLPTITIREGHRLKVLLTNDIEIHAYEPVAR